ncbi:CDP-alcohol phosphatidyltransferase family protein [Shewanella livingstonensis]|uniref:CDP-alcohol phosphatidyltransferase family protein n=1 Tax=Shewanella livingstonensis TaxID=150120 RepID=A0A3G8LX82_9GAMM|nr:CDP-alcohol phosphatidyltransferase family protein [Shewanella livingstonensis]AZG74296.1 CDP-alcohol phosphatidyltransferase family protein [Shewanella livingstonensis]
MLDKFITPVIKPLLTPVVLLLDKRKVHPDQLTLVGFGLGMLAVPLLALQLWYGALLFIALNRVIDGLDGALARHQKHTSAAGGYLDICLDFLFYAAIPLGFALANPNENALAAAVLLTVFIGTGSSFLAFAIPAEKLNLPRPQFAHKSFYFLNGLTEGTETIAFFMAFCLWPDYFPELAYTFAFLGAITIFTRIHGGYNTLKNHSTNQQANNQQEKNVKEPRT